MAELGVYWLYCERPTEETDYCCIQQSYSHWTIHTHFLQRIEHYVTFHASYSACIIFKIRLLLDVLLSSCGGGGGALSSFYCDSFESVHPENVCFALLVICALRLVVRCCPSWMWSQYMICWPREDVLVCQKQRRWLPGLQRRSASWSLLPPAGKWLLWKFRKVGIWDVQT